MKLIGVEVDGNCAKGEVKYRCCDSSFGRRPQHLSNCEFSNCKNKDEKEKCPRPGVLL